MIDKELVLRKLEGKKKEISEKVFSGKRIYPEEAVYMFREFDISLLGILASHLKSEIISSNVYFNRNIHLEPTNICIHNCLFCSYRRKINEEGSWELSLKKSGDSPASRRKKILLKFIL